MSVTHDCGIVCTVVKQIVTVWQAKYAVHVQSEAIDTLTLQGIVNVHVVDEEPGGTLLVGIRDAVVIMHNNIMNAIICLFMDA